MQSLQIITIVFNDGEIEDYTRTPEMMSVVNKLEKYAALKVVAREYLDFMRSKNGVGWLDYKAESERLESKLAAMLDGQPEEG